MSSRTKSSATTQSGFVDRDPDFKKRENSRPDFNRALHPVTVSKTPDPEWTWGAGVRGREPTEPPPTASEPTHVDIDPYAEGRSMMANYRLLVSGVVPRPIGFLSTVSADGRAENLAPFSYFQVVDHDPPTFVVGFSARPGRPKDTYRNLLESGECTINIVSEDMIEAVSAASVDAPYGVSEWEVSGLHRAETRTVRPARVQESVFSIEGKLVDTKEFKSHAKPGFSVASVVLIEATRFWVRRDALDESQSNIDLNVLKPIAQLGGISYGRVAEVFELPRKTWKDAVREAPWLQELPNAKK
ncbi:FMN-binding split barrel [Pleurostoma richardsiae]|uniref:FMN-binding split barrel n=1 Tax=Pleurostoma richardsiae TaxID=41990 RepID=A0AA38RSL5_9PEZI|nr:FMN-binding split barrel [Pleurostoma richardsiae]